MRVSMRLHRILLPALLVAGVSLPVDAAFAFRCGNKLVSKGDPAAKVLKICGEPVGVQQRVIYRSGFTRPRFRDYGPGIHFHREVLSYDRSYEEVLVEEWTYNFGPRRLMQLVRFENGFVADIRQIGYGYHE